ncbi:mucin-16, partial [Pteropus medius]|uniref:mucin-16 n=1 Tax=Pteropus vampyrus TaxID=132908 RepID=UPI00196B5790
MTVSLGVLAMVTSLITNSGTGTSTNFSNLTESLHESSTKVSLVTHPAESSSTVLRITPVSHDDSDNTPSVATSIETDTSSAIPNIPISPGVADMVTSQAASSETESSTVIPPLTLSPREPATAASWVIHSGAQTSSVIPTMTGSSGVVTSLVTSSGAEISTTFPTLTDFPHKPENTASWVTRFETGASLALPTVTLSPGERDTGVPLVTHPPNTSPFPPQTTPYASHSESDSTSSRATSPGTEASSTVPARTIPPLVSEVVTSQATSSGAETNATFSTLTDSQGHLKTTASWVIQFETEASAAIPTLTDFSGEPDTTVSLVNHPAEGIVSKTMPSFPHSVLNSTPSSATNAGTEASSVVPTLTVSLGVPDTSQVISSETDASTAILHLTLSPGEPAITASLATHPGVQISSAISPPTVSSIVPGLVASLGTSSGAEINTSFPTLTDSPHKPEATDSWITFLGTEASSIVPTLTISPGETDSTALRVHSAGTSTPVSRTTTNFSHDESDNSFSTATSPGAEASLDVPTTAVSPDVSGVVTSLLTSSRAETSTTFPTLTDFPHEQETTASWATHSEIEANSAVLTLTVSAGEADTTVSLNTHSAETSLIIPQTTPDVSHSESESTSSMDTKLKAEASSTVPTLIISPGVPDKVTSQVTISEMDASMAIPTLTLSSGEPATVALLVTHPSSETSVNFSASAVFPHLPDITTSLSIQPGSEISAALPTRTVSLGPPKASSSVFTALVNETSRSDLSPTVSLHVPVETASLFTPGTDLSTTISTSTLFHGLSETTGLLATSPASETSTDTTTLTDFSGVLGPASTPATTDESYTITSWSTQASSPAASVGLPEFSKTVTGGTVTLIAPKTSYGDGSSPTTILKTTTPETTNSAATHSGSTMAEITTTSSILSGSSFVSVTTPEISTLASVSVTSGKTVIPFLVHFIVNFTITNLHYMEDMGNLGSEIFNATERHLQQLLGPLFKNSSIGSLYAGCRLALLRAEKEETSTTVNIICTHHPDPTGFKLDTERLFWELSQQTHGVTQLGPYILDRNSLSINGYNHQYWIPTTSTLVTTFSPGSPASLAPTHSSTDVGPGPVPFTLNFTITNMLYTPDMRHPGSAKFNSTEKALNHLLGLLFKNTSIGPLYSGCRLTLLRTEKDGATTGVDIICTYHPDTMGSRMDREKLYQELSHLTHGVTLLGTYTLERGSLYVNGYNHQYWTPTTSAPVTSTFSPESSMSLSPNISSTGMSPSLVPFTLNFTITSLRYTEGMGNLGSEIFNTTEKILNRLLTPLFQNSSIGPLYFGCRLTLLRPEKNGTTTGIDTVCRYRPDHMGPRLDREQLYWELSHHTHGVTQLGFFTLDKDSLYVNGYTHQTPVTNPSATVTSMLFPGTSVVPAHFSSSVAGFALVPFTLNFTIINLRFTEDMHPGSAKFNSTESVIQHLLRPLITNSSIGSLYTGCRLTALRPEKGGAATGVDVSCTHRPDAAGFGLSRERLYWELSQQNHSVTQLGPYILDRDHLYVNGYTRPALTSIPSVSVTSTLSLGTTLAPISFSSSAVTGPALLTFTLNFIITNLNYTKDMQPLGSVKFNKIEKILQRLLRPLFKNTSVSSLYSSCRLTSL